MDGGMTGMHAVLDVPLRHVLRGREGVGGREGGRRSEKILQGSQKGGGTTVFKKGRIKRADNVVEQDSTGCVCVCVRVTMTSEEGGENSCATLSRFVLRNTTTRTTGGGVRRGKGAAPRVSVPFSLPALQHTHTHTYTRCWPPRLPETWLSRTSTQTPTVHTVTCGGYSCAFSYSTV